jgi:hypothetical protein
MAINNSLNDIISDILQIYFNSKPSDESQLSRMEVEFWIHQYRALLIKQDLDKGRDINESYMQLIPGLRLIGVDFGEDAKVKSNLYRFKTIESIPKPIDTHFGLPLIVYTINDEQLQIMPESRVSLHRYRKYTSHAPVAYYTNNHIYVEGCELLEYIKVKGVFENPADLAQYSDECFNPDAPYPIPSNMIPVLRQMILTRELGIMQQQGADIINNANDERTSPGTTGRPNSANA